MGIVDIARRFFTSSPSDEVSRDVIAMLPAARTAGYFAAQAVLTLSGGQSLPPFVGTEKGAAREHAPVAAGTPGAAVEGGKELLRANPHGAERAALVYDIVLKLGRTRSDAIMAEIIDYRFPKKPLKVAVPYRAASSEGGFAVHKPRFMTATELEPASLSALGDAFFEGVRAHAQGDVVWRERVDGRQ